MGRGRGRAKKFGIVGVAGWLPEERHQAGMEKVIGMSALQPEPSHQTGRGRHTQANNKNKIRVVREGIGRTVGHVR